ncbi:MAG: cupin domain-containing protein [Pseudomonadota bacterium]
MSKSVSRQPEVRSFPTDGLIPNNPALPMLIWRGVLPELALDSPHDVIRHLQLNAWAGAWINGIYPFQHYHARAHEVLVITSGSAEVIFGGPGGLKTTVSAGDVVVLPAGTGHCRLDEAPNFSVVGAYPAGQEDWDLKRDRPQDFALAQSEIPNVPLPKTDPLFGVDGPLVDLWPRP